MRFVLHRVGCLFGSLLFVATSLSAQTPFLAGGPPVAITRATDGPHFQPRWSPTGEEIAVTGTGYDGLWIVKVDGSGVRRLTDESSAGLGAVWAADGSALVTRVSRQDGVRRTHAIKWFDAVSGEGHALTEFRSSMRSFPDWSSGSSAVVLVGRNRVERFETGLQSTAGKTGNGEFSVTLVDGRPVLSDAAAGLVRRLDVFPGETLLNLVTSPDGRRVSFEVMGGHAFVCNLADRCSVPVDLGRGYRPQWSPDGDWIVYMRTEDDGENFVSSELVAVRADGSFEVALTDTPDRLEMNPSWSPDGSMIAFDNLVDGVIFLLPLSR